MNIRHEHRLMYLLLTESVQREELAQFIMTEDISWPFFLQESSHNGVSPLIWVEIRQRNFQDIIPPYVQNDLKKFYDQTAFYSLLLFKETEKIVKSLTQINIPVILFKGSALGEQIYKNIALRPCSDVDMLVHRESMPLVKNIFFEFGFSFPEGLMNERFYYQNHFHIPFHKNLKPFAITIEAHWNLMDKYLLRGTNIDEIWERKKPLRFEEVETFGLSDEDELIYLAMHILKHGYMNVWIASDPKHLEYLLNPAAENKLIWFIDLKKIIDIKGENIQWNTIIERAASWGILESIRPIFSILRQLFPLIPIPKDLLRPDKPIKVAWFKKLLFKAILTQKDSSFIRKHFLTMKGDLQFRLIRIFDIFEYMLPKYSIIAKIYRFKNPFAALIYYPFHFFKTLSLAFFGLFQWMVYSRDKEKIQHHH